MLDRHADVVNAATRQSLGSWIRGRLKNGVEARGSSADQELAKIDISVSELRCRGGIGGVWERWRWSGCWGWRGWCRMDKLPGVCLSRARPFNGR